MDQYPPQQWLPPNVSLRGLDICASIPNELLGKYDVIHVRHFLLVVEDDPKSLLKNLVALLSMLTFFFAFSVTVGFLAEQQAKRCFLEGCVHHKYSISKTDAWSRAGRVPAMGRI